MPPEIVFLAVGANEGDPRGNIKTAIGRLAEMPGIRVVAVSDLIVTDPVDAPKGSGVLEGQFLNGVVQLEVALSPFALLSLCKQLEVQAGRDLDAPRNAPRPLDLDILFFGDRTIDSRELRVPHPRMFEREFVLHPLSQLVDVATLPRVDVPADLPIVCHDSEEFAGLASRWHLGGCSLGLVPTMGALHEGHASLVRMARAECDRVAVTIFVNPLQFGAGEDLDAYPRTFAVDLQVLREIGVDAVFAPQPADVYPEDFCSAVRVGAEAETMEGATRPGHFEGVTTVVAKLFNLARPTHAYFGQKDAQQVAVIRRMVLDLSYPLALRVGPIIREVDGLALSSRNRYLSTDDRAVAPILYRGLCAAREQFSAGVRDPDALLAAARSLIETEPAVRLDYLELRRDPDLLPLPAGVPVESGRLLVAAFLGERDGAQTVRLLDNLALSEDPTSAG